MSMRTSSTLAASYLMTCVLSFTGSVLSRTAEAQLPDDRAIVRQLLANEEAAAKIKPPVLYTSDERSDRTGGHLWEERVADVQDGKMRLLVAEDGKALSPERRTAEVNRLRSVAADPRDFLAAERATKDDEQHARQMLNLLPQAFVFERAPTDTSRIKLLFKPDPSFTPKTYEERVLHGMSGSLVIDARSLRLQQIEGRLEKDVSFGFGVLAVLRSGSSFSTTRDPISTGVWKTTSIQTDFYGRAILFKTIARKQQTVHKDFSPLPESTSIVSAADLLLRGNSP